jgi:branched-chain amino acid transport system substrate-binding protein
VSASWPCGSGPCGTTTRTRSTTSARRRPSSTSGVAGSGAVDLWHTLHAANPHAWLLGSDGVAVRRLAEALEPTAAERTRFFVANRAPFAFYGHEAMALALDAIVAGDGERAAVTRAARETRDRDSVLGRYSIDADGHTTSTAYGRLAVVHGALV